jgi:hypothetical protein
MASYFGMEEPIRVERTSCPLHIQKMTGRLSDHGYDAPCSCIFSLDEKAFKIEIAQHDLEKVQMSMTRYTVVHYLNGRISHSNAHLSMRSAYESAVPNEAFVATPGNRWHVMLYPAAIERLGALFVGETLRVCWQEYDPNFDTQYSLIVREEDSFDNMIPNNLMNMI